MGQQIRQIVGDDGPQRAQQSARGWFGGVRQRDDPGVAVDEPLEDRRGGAARYPAIGWRGNHRAGDHAAAAPTAAHHAVAAPAGFTALKLAGAAYLAYLGVRAMRRPSPVDGAEPPPIPMYQVFRDGLLINLLNPKVVLFFLAFLPQFVSGPETARGEMLVLGAVFFGIALVMDLGYALSGDLLRRVLRRRGAAARYQHIAVGTVYFGLAGYAALL
ncbi:LysE family translocator [Phytoactinopolyspora limicola]|uniref:LysE family translocator n=1 Tax=Phytoactinopolyspora limicola TaxID=2715536 RepID=UPI001A9C8D08|nr:LysE family translocator [Phytoactinopolyspora limicola]